MKRTNEEFQKTVLEELKELKNGQQRLEDRQGKLEAGQQRLEGRQEKLEASQKEIVRSIGAATEKTTDFDDFKEETNKKIDRLIADNRSICEILGEHEVTIRTMRRQIV